MEAFDVTIREEIGTRAVRRLRAAGQTPATLYGHGQANVSLTVPTRQVQAAMRHGDRFVSLRGAVSEQALVRDVQWDAFGTCPLHIDFARVSADERVTVQVVLELRGEAPGSSQGGVVEQLVHELEVECPAAGIPEVLQVDIRQLEIGQSVIVGDISLPDGVAISAIDELVVAVCSNRLEELADEGDGGFAEVASEPELVGRDGEDSSARLE